MKIGDRITESTIITEEQIEEFARVTGDQNPIHMNKEKAALYHQPERVVHGLFLNSYLSAMMGMWIPGTMIMDQQVRFLRPVRMGDQVNFQVTVTELDCRYHHEIGTLVGECFSQQGELMMTMSCHQLIPLMKKSEEEK